MRTVHVQELSAEKFGLYGTFADMLHAAGPHIGTNPIEFYRNMTTVYSPGASVGLSITKVYRCLLYASPSPRDGLLSRMPSSA